MRIDVLKTTSHGDRSYLVHDGGTAVVIGSQRDTHRVLTMAANRRVRIALVLETHLPRHDVSGGPELAAAAGADYVVPAGHHADHPHIAAVDGDVFQAGPLRLRAVHTPGHTHPHVSLEVTHADGTMQAVFTGDADLYGTARRTGLTAELPAGTPVFRTHVFTSCCPTSAISGDASNDGEQARGGAAPTDHTRPRLLDPAELARRLTVGEWVVDLRTRTDFAAGHLPGALNFELTDDVIAYLGWLYDWGSPLTLIADTDQQVAHARRQLTRLGVGRINGAAIGPVEALVDGKPLRRYPVSDFAGLAAARQSAHNPGESLTVLDVRRDDERADGGVTGSRHISLHVLRARMHELPDGEVWVYCGTGHRAAIAASFLARAGFAPVLVDGRYGDPDAGAAAVGLHTDEPAAA